MPAIKNHRIFVAGHRGLIGSAIVRRLEHEQCGALLLRTREELELTNREAVFDFFRSKKPEIVFMAAGKVGGIIENRDHPASFISQNLRIQTNIMEAADEAGTQKLVFFGSSCMYPRECPQPMAENLLLTGKPEPTSMAYAIAKLAGVQSCLAYNQESGGTRFIPLIPNSAYGPNDNFDPKSGHVLSALITRFHEAKTTCARSVTLWGSGSPRREFVHADDIADAAVFLASMETQNMSLPLNIGTGTDISSRELAELIAEVIGYEGRLEWDTTKPDGAPRKLLDSTRVKALGWSAKIPLQEGIRSTYQWFLNNNARAAGNRTKAAAAG
jgi:GDP-L-fucose synthase